MAKFRLLPAPPVPAHVLAKRLEQMLAPSKLCQEQMQAKTLVHVSADVSASPKGCTRVSRLEVEQFKSNPGENLTERRMAKGREYFTEHGMKPFERNSYDAGPLNALIRKGWLRHVSGEPDSKSCILQFTVDMGV